MLSLGIEMLTGKKPQNDTTTNSLVAVCCNGDWTDHLESSGDHLESSGASVRCALQTRNAILVVGC